MSELTGAEFKAALRNGSPKMGLFVNSHSPTVAEQLAHSGYDWLLIDTQHGPMNPETLSYMIGAVGSGGAKSMVRVGGYSDRPGIQQGLNHIRVFLRHVFGKKLGAIGRGPADELQILFERHGKPVQGAQDFSSGQ